MIADYQQAIPKEVGDGIIIMIRIEYLGYHPKDIFPLPSGFTFYKSFFEIYMEVE